MNKNKKWNLVLAFVLGSVVTFCAGPILKTGIMDKKNVATLNDTKEFQRIVDVINIIENRFVGKEETPTKDKLYEGAVAGIVKTLNDPYSEYLAIEDLKDFEEDMQGEYVGVGMTVQKKRGEPLEVVSPFVGSPAEKVGIKIKDKIIKVDGKDILPLTANETTKMLRGKENTKVTVEVIREGKKDPITFTLTRAKIKLEMVESKMLEGNIGYLSLLRFGNNVADEVEKEIVKLKEQGMKGLILDLRSNPGGSLAEAQDISSLFVKENIMVYLKYKNLQRKYYTRTKQYLGDFPLIVLTNKGSASASEIVTGAIKDYKRGTIIGDKTFGKGIVQQVISLRNNDALKLTIAQYFTPNGNYIHDKGIEPDIKVEMEEMIALRGYTNESEQARENRRKEIKEILIKDKGEAEAKKILDAGDVQMERALQEMKKMLNKAK